MYLWRLLSGSTETFQSFKFGFMRIYKHVQKEWFLTVFKERLFLFCFLPHYIEYLKTKLFGEYIWHIHVTRARMCLASSYQKIRNIIIVSTLKENNQVQPWNCEKVLPTDNTRIKNFVIRFIFITIKFEIY